MAARAELGERAVGSHCECPDPDPASGNHTRQQPRLRIRHSMLDALLHRRNQRIDRECKRTRLGRDAAGIELVDFFCADCVAEVARD